MVDKVAQRYQDELPRIKKNIESSYLYFRPNYMRFHEFRRFVFLSTLTEDDISVLKTLMKPQIEFNMIEAYISRQRGEFSKQEPSVIVSSDYDNPVDPQVEQVIEGHLRHMECEARKNSCEYRVYTDLLSGGFSAIKVWTDYSGLMSTKQVIKFDRVYDPTLCGWDPLAQQPHKADGRYCFECFPKTKDEFHDEYPDIDLDKLSFAKNVDGFTWSSRDNKNNETLIIVDYYEKKKKKINIVQISNGQTMDIDEYKEMISTWSSIEQAPQIIGKPIKKTKEMICRYRMIEDQVLEYVETDYAHLPIVFIDGNSIMIREGENGNFQQHTRPYAYHVKGTQKLKNYAGQSLANELENMVQHKWKVAKESIPPQFADAYTNNQVPSVVIYNAFKDNDPNIPLPPPQEVVRPQIPPEITNTFMLTDQVSQTILGSYDASLGINNNQLSGIAIQEGATQSNAAAMPYINGFLDGYTQVFQVIVDLIPKYYVTPRTIPVMDKEGKKNFVRINANGKQDLKYDTGTLNVRVEAGVNFAIQKSRALMQLTAIMQASPLFAQFMNQEGLDIMLDNLEIRGIDTIKERALKFMQTMKQQPPPPNPAMLKLQNEKMNLQREAKKDQVEAQIEAARLQLDQQALMNDRAKLALDAQSMKAKTAIEFDKHQTEKTRAAVDLVMKQADMGHRHSMEIGELGRKITDTTMKHYAHESTETPMEENLEHV